MKKKKEREQPSVASILHVRVQPRASRSEITGWRDGVLQVRLTAPPVEGAANAACVELLADVLDVPKSAISLASGAHAREKGFRIEGLSPEDLQRRLPPQA